jgi:hypothetical protein
MTSSSSSGFTVLSDISVTLFDMGKKGRKEIDGKQRWSCYQQGPESTGNPSAPAVLTLWSRRASVNTSASNASLKREAAS